MKRVVFRIARFWPSAPGRGENVLALVSEHRAHSGVAHQTIDARATPRGGPGRVLMEEVPPMSKLVPIDLGGEAEAHLPLDQAPAELVEGHLREVDVLVKGA